MSKRKGLPSSPQPHLAPTVSAWELQLQQGFPVLVAVPEDRVTYTLGFHKTQVSSGWLVSTFSFFMRFAVLSSSECCWPLHQLFLLIAPSPSSHCSYGTSPSCFKDTQVYFIGVWLSPILMATDDIRLSWLLCTIRCEVTGEAGLPQETRLHLDILTGISQAEGEGWCCLFLTLCSFDSLGPCHPAPK